MAVVKKNRGGCRVILVVGPRVLVVTKLTLFRYLSRLSVRVIAPTTYVRTIVQELSAHSCTLVSDYRLQFCVGSRVVSL